MEPNDEHSLMCSLFREVLKDDEDMNENESKLLGFTNFKHGTLPVIMKLSKLSHDNYNDLSELDSELKEMTLQGGPYGPNLNLDDMELIKMKDRLVRGNYQ